MKMLYNKKSSKLFSEYKLMHLFGIYFLCVKCLCYFLNKHNETETNRKISTNYRNFVLNTYFLKLELFFTDISKLILP